MPYLLSDPMSPTLSFPGYPDLIVTPAGERAGTLRDGTGGPSGDATGQAAPFEAVGWGVASVPLSSDGDERRFLGREGSAPYERAVQNLGVWGEIFQPTPARRKNQTVRFLSEAYRRVFAANRVALAASGYADVPVAPTPEYWETFRRVAEWDGTPLDTWQMWGLLRVLGYSEACCASVDHVLGIEGPFWATMSAGETFELLEAVL